MGVGGRGGVDEREAKVLEGEWPGGEWFGK